MQDQHFQIAMLEQPGQPAVPPAAAAMAVFAVVVLVVRGAGEAAFAVMRVAMCVVGVMFMFQISRLLNTT